jgi:hypothetical protein
VEIELEVAVFEEFGKGTGGGTVLVDSLKVYILAPYTAYDAKAI